VKNLLQVSLLGAPIVTFQQNILKFPSRKALALLIYLIVTGERHNRQHLMALLWPESESKRAGASLRSTVTRLRRTLAVAGDYLLAEAGMLAFDADQSFSLDLHLLDAAVSSNARPEVMRAALSTVRGPFLDGFSLPDAPDFELWVTQEREARLRQLEAICHQLTHHYISVGETGEAVYTAQQWVMHAPLSEAAHRGLMEAYFLNHDRTAALKAYDRCIQMLRDELGLPPEPDTTALAQRIREFPLQTRPARVRDRSPASHLSRPRLVELPLVGRSVEYARLVALYRQASMGHFQCVAIIGEAGMGKTRLANAFLNWIALENDGADVLQGRAFEVGGRLPYQILVDALRSRLDQENAPADLLADVWLAELSQLLPELRERYPDLPPPLSGEPEFMRGRIFEAVARLLVELAQRRPLVLFLDDLQWADAGALDMLHYLACRLSEEKAPVLFLFAARTEDMARLEHRLAYLDREIHLTKIHLTPLSVEAVQKLVTALAGEIEEAVVDPFGDWLQSETGGVPFFVEAMLQMFAEQGALLQEERNDRPYLDVVNVWRRIQRSERTPIPPGVREVIVSRLNRLDDAARSLLLGGAVLGREASFEQLCWVSGVGEEKGLDALETLLNRRLLLEKRHESRPYRFAHDTIRQIVYAEAGEARRRWMHRRALTALQKAAAPSPELAYHALAVHENELAFHYLLDAGDAALSTHALTEALEHYQHARELASRVRIDAEPLARLYTRRGQVLEWLHRYNEALANHQEMEALGKKRDDRALVLASITAQCHLHAVYTPLYEPEQANALAHKALALARSLGDRATEASVLRGLMMATYWGKGDIHQACAYGERALDIAEELGLTDQKAFIQAQLVHVYFGLGMLEDAHRLNLEARKVWEAVNNMAMLVDSYIAESWMYIFYGQFDAAKQAIDWAFRLSRAHNGAGNFVFALATQGAIDLERGESGRAIEVLEEALEHARKMNLSVIAYLALPSLIRAYLLVGATERASELSKELHYVRMPQFRHYFRTVAAPMIQVMLEQKDYVAAQQLLVEAYQHLERDQIPMYISNLSVVEARLHLALGDAERALREMQKLEARARETNFKLYLLEALWVQGCALRALNRPLEARRVLREARAEFEAMHARRMGYQILTALWEVEQDLGATTAAHQIQKEALEIIAYLAKRTGTEERRAGFLARPEVQRVLRLSSPTFTRQTHTMSPAPIGR